ncbi:hypothetical protein CSAL01_11631 [Colletotrichum salicis]|uniref:Uncharacterized protein n=1 Tax=Colletotrichum salicis TaxID=1209931 RepID=A0A135SCQ0_9PEZI|nr:hypothetical protein CSAL01_11631 [Colletotrichum salicis]
MPSDELSAELWLFVSSYLSQSDKARLIRVNQRLHDILEHDLYMKGISDDDSDCVTHTLKTGNLDMLKRAHGFGADIAKAYPVAVLGQEESPPSGPMDRYFHRRIGCGMNYLNLDRMTTWGTLLYQAAAGGHFKMVRWLLEQNVDVDGPGRSMCLCMPIGKRASGRFARSFSASYRPAYKALHIALCQRSAFWDPELGAETSLFAPYTSETKIWGLDALESSRPLNALHDAARAGNLEMITYLVEDRGIPVDSPDEMGATPIDYACEYHPSSRNPSKEQEVVSHLLSLGSKVQISFSSSLDDSGLVDVDTALDDAIIRGSTKAVKRLAMVEDCLWFTHYGCSGPKLSQLRWLFTPSGDAHENYWDLTLDSLAAISEDLIRQTKQTHRPEYAALQYELQSTFLLVCQLSSCPPMMHYDKERHELSGSSLGMLALCVTIGAMDWEPSEAGLDDLGLADDLGRKSDWHAGHGSGPVFSPRSIDPFIRLLAREGAWFPSGKNDLQGIARVYEAWKICVRDLHERPDITPEWALAIRDDLDDCSERPKVEEMLRQHGLIDEGNYVEEEDSDYAESAGEDENNNEEESVEG